MAFSFPTIVDDNRGSLRLHALIVAVKHRDCKRGILAK